MSQAVDFELAIQKTESICVDSLPHAQQIDGQNNAKNLTNDKHVTCGSSVNMVDVSDSGNQEVTLSLGTASFPYVLAVQHISGDHDTATPTDFSKAKIFVCNSEEEVKQAQDLLLSPGDNEEVTHVLINASDLSDTADVLKTGEQCLNVEDHIEATSENEENVRTINANITSSELAEQLKQSDTPEKDLSELTSIAQQAKRSTLLLVTENGKYLMEIPTSEEGQSKSVYACPFEGCGKKFSEENKLKVHITSHSFVRPYKCTYTNCDWSFPTQYKLRRHLESHGRKKKYCCDFNGCTRRFTTAYNLNAHKKLHWRPCIAECPVESCSEKFPTKRQLFLHLKDHKEVKEPYLCSWPDCNRGFYSSNSLASHHRSHTSQAPKVCPFEDCGQVFDKFCRLKQHLRKHTGERPYVCSFDQCEWTFASASKLKRHMRSHTQERNFICSEEGCGKKFMRPEHLRVHMNTHTGEKRYVCSFEACTSRFSTKQSLYMHIKKHDLEGLQYKISYTCPVSSCSKRYSLPNSLKTHVGKQHPDIDASKIDCEAMVFYEEVSDKPNSGDSYAMDEAVQTCLNVKNESVVFSAADDIVTNPNEFMHVSEQSNDQMLSSVVHVNAESVICQHVGNNVVTQFILPADLVDTGIDQAAAFTEIETAEDTPSVSKGSARTDSMAQRLMNDRTRKRKRQSPGTTKKSSDFEPRDIVLPPPTLSFETQLMQDDPPPAVTSETDIECLLNTSQPLSTDLLASPLVLTPNIRHPLNADVERGVKSSVITSQPSLSSSQPGQELALHVFLQDSSESNLAFSNSTINLQDLE